MLLFLCKQAIDWFGSCHEICPTYRGLYFSHQFPFQQPAQCSSDLLRICPLVVSLRPGDGLSLNCSSIYGTLFGVRFTQAQLEDELRSS